MPPPKKKIRIKKFPKKLLPARKKKILLLLPTSPHPCPTPRLNTTFLAPALRLQFPTLSTTPQVTATTPPSSRTAVPPVVVCSSGTPNFFSILQKQPRLSILFQQISLRVRCVYNDYIFISYSSFVYNLAFRFVSHCFVTRIILKFRLFV